MGGTVVSLNNPTSSHPTVIEGETVIEHGLLRQRRPRPALGHGLASGDVRFRPSTGPIVNRSSMSAPDPFSDLNVIRLSAFVRAIS